MKEFPPNHKWINSNALRFNEELRGKIVVIDFWTYCCINCLHTLPDLEWLETKYEDNNAVAFIGCHSAKFKNEKDGEKVREAVLKYEVRHPVINDDKMTVWRNFERRSWPSIVIVAPTGAPIYFLTGEGHRDRIDVFIEACLKHYMLELNKEPIDLFLEEDVEHQTKHHKQAHRDELQVCEQ